MKRNFILMNAAAVILPCLLTAQPVLDQSLLPGSGDVAYIYYADTTGVSEGPGGAAQTWDFSQMTVHQSGYMLGSFVEVGSTPYHLYYPNANLCYFVPVDGYNYYGVDANSLVLLGQAMDAEKFIYSDSQVMFTFPFAFNSQVADTFVASAIVGSDTTFRNGSTNVTADAYGELLLPSETFQSTLRIFSDITFTQTDAGTSYTINLKQYQWYDGTALLPVFTINNVSVFHEDTLVSKNKVINVLRYSPAFLGEKPIQPLSITLFPNPAVDYIEVSVDIPGMEEAILTLTDLAGRKAGEYNASTVTGGQIRQRMDVATLPRGIYLATIRSGRHVAVAKIVLQ
jgi:hypothetical protein